MYEKIYSIKDRYDIYIKSTDTDLANIINSAGNNKKVYILNSITVTSPQIITATGITIDSDPSAFIVSQTPGLSGIVTFSGEGYTVKNINIMSQNSASTALQLNANGSVNNFLIVQSASLKTLDCAVRINSNVIANISGRTKAVSGTIAHKIIDPTAISSYNIDGQVFGLNIADSLSQHTVLFHSYNPFVFTGNSLTYATTGMEIRVVNSVTTQVLHYTIPLGESLNFTSDGSILYAIIKRDGSGTGTIPSTSLTVANANLVVDATTIPKLDTADSWYLPIAMRLDSSTGPLLHWFFGHGTWVEWTSLNVGISGGFGGLGTQGETGIQGIPGSIGYTGIQGVTGIGGFSSNPSFQIEFFDNDDLKPAQNIRMGPTENMAAIGFPSHDESIIYFQFSIPKDFDLNKDIKLTLGYEMTTSYVGVVNFKLYYESYNVGQDLPIIRTTEETLNVCATEGLYQEYTMTSLIIDKSDFSSIGQEIMCSLRRDVSGITLNHNGTFILIGLTIFQ